MFLPLTLEGLMDRLLLIGQTEGWKHSTIWWLAKKPLYHEHKILKKQSDRNLIIGDGAPPKIRVIHEPCRSLKKIQTFILHRLLTPAKDELLGCAHGCVPGRSTVTNAIPHVGCKFKIHMDLKDFFPTVTVQRVYGLFRKVFQYEVKLAWLLANLCCHDGRLPQGAPTSPMIANLIAMQMDRRLVKLLRAMNGYYTRYVDDLTFSFRRGMSQKSRERFIGTVRQIATDCGFTVNEGKTSVVWNGRRMVVTGVVVNTSPSIPKEFRSNLRAAFHHMRLNLPTAEPEMTIWGKWSYVNMVNHRQAATLHRNHFKR